MYVEKQLWEVSKSSSWLQVSIQEMCVEIQLWGASKSRSWLRISIQKMCVERQLWETSKSRRWLWVSIQIKHLAPGQPQASACHGVLSSQAYSANILLDHSGTNCQFYLLVFSVITEVGWDSRFSKVTCCLFQSFSLAMNCRWQRSHTVCSVRMFMCWGWALIVLARNTSKSGKIAITLSPEKSEHYLMIQCSNGSFFVVVGYSQDLWKLRLLSSLGY